MTDDRALREQTKKTAQMLFHTLDDDDGSYIKIIDVGQKVVLNKMNDYLPGRLVPLLINLHIQPRPIWLTRHGESTFNVRGLIGGDAELSPMGERYGRALRLVIDHEFPEDAKLSIWTSTLRRTVQTAWILGRPSTKSHKNFEKPGPSSMILSQAFAERTVPSILRRLRTMPSSCISRSTFFGL